MKSKVFFISLLLVSVCMAGVIGFYVGNQFTKKKLDDYYLQLHYDSIATEMKSQVKVLELLRKNDIGEGTELLEKFMDVNLASLNLYGKTPPAERSKEIIDVIRQTKDYRKKYSKHHVDPVLFESVQNALGIVE